MLSLSRSRQAGGCRAIGRQIALAMATVGSLAAGGCGTGAGNAADGLTGSIRVHGSSTVYPVSEAVAEEFRREQPRVKITVGQSGTGGGMKKLWQGDIDICDASREMTQSERELCLENGIEFIELKIAFDGLALVVHPENDWVDCLTLEQLKSIWQPASPVTSWSDVDPSWPDEPLVLYGPGTDSGTFDYFTKVVMGEEKASRADYTASENDNVLVTGIQSDRYALGYFGFAYYEENRERLKLLGVDPGDGTCVQPSSETVRDNSYRPLSRPLYIYVNQESLARPEVAAFIRFYLENAAALAADVGYVPVSEEVEQENREALAAAQPAEA